MTEAEQLLLPGGPRSRARAPSAPPAAADVDPVATVRLDLPLPHLDHPFDYLVPARFADVARPGVRVRVRFSGRLVDGFLLERRGVSEHAGRLSFLDRVVSSEPVLAEEVLALAEEVAQRWAGTVSDVLRLAVPPRHARAESAAGATSHPGPARGPAAGPWADHPEGAGLLEAIAAGGAPHALWTPAPGAQWARGLAVAAGTALSSDRGALIVVPDASDVAAVDVALREVLGPGRHVCLTADLGPQARYSRWLRVRREEVRVVVGTRSAVFAPVAALGLVAIWDDGSDLHVEPRAPYFHARDVLLLRAHRQQAAAILAGPAVTAEAAALVRSGWCKPVLPGRALLRSRGPRVEAISDDQSAADPAARAARLPSVAWRRARESLAAGLPVLVQVPRRGYVPGLACTTCRQPATCGACGGPLALSARDVAPSCRLCGRLATTWSCRRCAGAALRATSVGVGRTAEEIGRAFPGASVHSSTGDARLNRVPAGPHVVVATPGVEPPADGGYGAVLLLDSWAQLGRAGMRAAEQTLARWAAAAALARPAAQGGRVLVVADAGLPVVQALIRGDLLGFAERELDERAELGLPPAVRIAALTGSSEAVGDLLGAVDLPAEAEVLGPVAIPGTTTREAQVRAVVRAPRAAGLTLAQALRAAQATRSARRSPGVVKVEVDPLEPI